MSSNFSSTSNALSGGGQNVSRSFEVDHGMVAIILCGLDGYFGEGGHDKGRLRALGRLLVHDGLKPLDASNSFGYGLCCSLLHGNRPGFLRRFLLGPSCLHPQVKGFVFGSGSSVEAGANAMPCLGKCAQEHTDFLA